MPAYRSSSKFIVTGTGTNPQTSTIAKPTNTAAGDRLIFLVAAEAAGAQSAVVPPAGFTQIRTWTAIRPPISAYGYTAGSSEPTTYSFQYDAANWSYAFALVAISSAGSVLDGNAEGGSSTAGTSLVAPSVTATVASDVLLVIGSIDNFATAATFTAPSGMTIAQNVSTASGNAQMGVAYQNLTATGATGAKTMTSSTAASSGQGGYSTLSLLISSLNPAAGPPVSGLFPVFL